MESIRKTILRNNRHSDENTNIMNTLKTRNSIHTIRTESNIKKNKSVSLNLMEKFDGVRGKESINLKNYFSDLMNSNKKNSISLINYSNKNDTSNQEFLNEILNKVNYYKQMVNFKEEINKIYIDEVKGFLDYFIKIFNELKNDSNENHLMEMRESLERIEELIYSNENLVNEENTHLLEEKEFFMNILNNLFKSIEINSNSELNQNFYLESANVNNMIEKMNEIKTFGLKSKLNLPEELDEYSDNIVSLSNKKIKKLNRRSQNLLDTAYMKKSKAIYGEDDEVITLEEDLIKKEDSKYKSILSKTNNLFLRNFIQIFYTKDEGIFSESMFCKIDKSLLSQYRNFKFYEVKFYFSNNESFKDITEYIKQIRKLFTRYIMMYREEKDKKFTKITICGVGKRQSLMKSSLINFLTVDVKLDCLVKFSLFSNIFDSMMDSLKKINRKKNYYFFTNFSNEVLSKIINKIKN